MHTAAQQPGQVKEDILIRMGELGLTVQQGQVPPPLFESFELPTEAGVLSFTDIDGNLLHRAESADIFSRNGNISKIVFCLANQSWVFLN